MADDCTNSNEAYWLRVSWLNFSCYNIAFPFNLALPFSLQLDGADSSDEVCPLLLPPATPTGDYIQPVRIDRDLELVTRNLPEPPVSSYANTSSFTHFSVGVAPLASVTGLCCGG